MDGGQIYVDLKDFLDSVSSRLTGRRGFEWSEGAGDNDPDWGSEGETPRRRSRRMPIFFAVLAGLFTLFFILLPWLAFFITEFYWYESLGFTQVFWRRFTAQAQLFAAVFMPTFIIYLLNWLTALRNSLDAPGAAAGGGIPARSLRKTTITAALLFSLFGALGATGMWDVFLRFLNSTPFGESDPIFNKDIGFYVFSLPFLSFLRSRLQSILVVSLIGSVAIYSFTRAYSLVTDGLRPKLVMPRRIKLHLTMLGALILSVLGVGYCLDRYSLLFSPSGIAFGAGYTDVTIIMPSLSVMAFAVFAAAALLILNYFKPLRRTFWIIAGATFALGWLSLVMLPGLVQQYRVKPNEYELEERYIAYNLDYTRRAFGLNNVTTVMVTPGEGVTAEELAADLDTVRNVRLWDYSPLLRTYNQLQAIRTYYSFSDVFIDRYEINGLSRQVILAVRELDLTQLQNRTWVNSHLEFTHGYGVVMNPVNEVAPGGLPNFFMKDLPTRSTVDIKVDRPEIYYGTQQASYVLVNTAVKEFDYPMGNSNVRSVYEGGGGVAIGSMWRRLLFALRFRDSEILFTNVLNSKSRILFNRNAQQAIAKLAPFLFYDQDIYPVLYGGRILWAQDCFSWSASYPYSRPFTAGDGTLAHFNGVNYIRNSVKATVDAYDGRIDLYLVDVGDPVAETWRKIFPALFKDGGQMPDGLRSHMRYPENFFEIQTEVYRTYHMSDTNTYYNREDVWEVTPVGRQRRIQPNYLTMKLWGGENPEFAIIIPYMPLGRDNLIGWMAGRCDPEKYGELLVYEFPKQTQLYGPAQIEALIDQNPEISAQLSLWGQHGSDVIRGDLLVIPIGQSLLYVQPLYIKAERGEMPELKRVIVSTGGRVAWAETFAEALERLVGRKVTESRGAMVAAETGESAKPKASVAAGAPEAANVSELTRRAQELYDSAMRAQREGNWALYGSEIKKLGEALSEMDKLLQ